MHSHFVTHLGFYSIEDQIHCGATLHVASPILSIPCLLMLWWLREPRHQQAWYWQDRPEYYISSIRRVKSGCSYQFIHWKLWVVMIPTCHGGKLASVWQPCQSPIMTSWHHNISQISEKFGRQIMSKMLIKNYSNLTLINKPFALILAWRFHEISWYNISLYFCCQIKIQILVVAA